MKYLNVALGYTFQISQSIKWMENWDFQMLANKLYFQIFPNSLKRWKIGILENEPRLYFPIFSKLTKRLKIGITEYWQGNIK